MRITDGLPSDAITSQGQMLYIEHVPGFSWVGDAAAVAAVP
jgi:hypothetical protein